MDGYAKHVMSTVFDNKAPAIAPTERSKQLTNYFFYDVEQPLVPGIGEMFPGVVREEVPILPHYVQLDGSLFNGKDEEPDYPVATDAFESFGGMTITGLGSENKIYL